jgi:hypothetical protein
MSEKKNIQIDKGNIIYIYYILYIWSVVDAIDYKLDLLEVKLLKL